MKCMPMKRSGRFVTAASSVMEMLEVFEARMAPSPTTVSTARNTFLLMSASSMMASTTRSQPASASMPSTAVTRPTAASASACVIFSLATKRPRLLAMPSRPRVTAAALLSNSVTGVPATANTWAMPAPI